MTNIDTISVALTADTSGFKKQIGEAEKQAKSFGKALTGSLVSAATSGKGLTDIFSTLAMKLSSMALKSALTPLTQGFSGGLFGGGGAGSNVDVPFAQGGVVSAPSYFPMSSGQTGVMGEAGHEAIMPLSRTSDGRLGVKTEGKSNMNIVFNVQATDAASFKRSEQDINAMLARAVGRGNRSL
jgi:phage-related minor tail protein